VSDEFIIDAVRCTHCVKNALNANQVASVSFCLV